MAGFFESIGNFAKGTGKQAVFDGWTGMKAGAKISAALGAALTVGIVGFGFAGPLLAVAIGTATFGLSLPVTAKYGAITGASVGAIRGGTKEVKQVARSEQQELEVQRANAEFRKQKASKQNDAVTDIANQYHNGQQAPMQQQHAPHAGKVGNMQGNHEAYQMNNHLANKPAGHFTQQYAQQKQQQQLNPQQNVVGG